MTEGWAECPNCAHLNPPGSVDCARCRQRLEHEVHQEWEVASNWPRTGAALVDALIAAVIAVAWFNGVLGSYVSGSGLASTVILTATIYLLPA